MESRRSVTVSKSASPNPDQGHSEAQCNGLLVIGDDSISNQLAEHFEDQEDVLFVGMRESLFDDAGDPERPFMEVNRITDLFDADIGFSPTTVIVATSEDSQNLLIVTHLQQKLDIDEIVVRLNEPQYIDAFADLSVDFVDVASIISSAIADELDSPSESQ